MLGQIKKMYKLLPTPISHFLVKAFRLNPYANRKIWERVDLLEKKLESFDLDGELLHEFVDCSLAIVGSFSSEVSAYWRSRLSACSMLDSDSIRKIEPMDSEELRKEFDRIANKRVRGYLTSTGGSGRSPTKIYLSDSAYYENIVHVLFSWKKLGYQRGDRKLTLRGIDLGKELVRFNPIYNEILVNAFLMSENNISEIMKKVAEFNPSFAHGYPSIFCRLAKLLMGKDFKITLKGVSFASEGFTETQRDLVEDIFSCPVRGFYGHSERASFATELPKHKGIYKVLPTYGFVEILGKDSERVRVGEFGEVVCTGFINEGMPLIRYRTGDYAVLHKEVCGIVTEISNLVGRWGKDFLVDKYGNEIPTTAANVHLTAQFDFKYIQLWQDKAGSVLIKVVPWKEDRHNWPKALEISREFQSKLSNFDIDVALCSEKDLYISKRGKVPYLVSYKDDSNEPAKNVQ